MFGAAGRIKVQRHVNVRGKDYGYTEVAAACPLIMYLNRTHESGDNRLPVSMGFCFAKEPLLPFQRLELACCSTERIAAIPARHRTG